MFGKYFEFNEVILHFVEELGRHMPGGFLIYKSAGDGELLYENEAVHALFGCRDGEEFRTLTGCSFRGMVHPEDREAVLASIGRRVSAGDAQMDHLEFRIIRKDGAVRWVDDCGHYTETEKYGGIFYVFLTDITEQREQMETNVAMRNAVVEALSKSYHTVWLINDVETEYVSLYRGDTSDATIHGAPNRDALNKMTYSQAKDNYIRSTVAPEDQPRLQRALTLKELVRRLAGGRRYNVSYRRIMDDGSRRWFRIEFARMNMPGGKTGIVCGFKDVDDEVREEQEHRKALQERLALQEKLLEEEKQQAMQNKLITALSSDYWSVYYLDLDKNDCVCYQESGEADDFRLGDHFDYLSCIAAYAERFVNAEYREEFLRFVQPDAIREGLRTRRIISYRYLIHRGGSERYVMIRFAGVRHPEDRDDHIVHAVGLSFTDVDEETRKTLQQSETLRDALTGAQQANRAKTAFLSSMSHEIRTPMNAIIGLNSIALNDPELSLKTRECLEKIGSSARHLLNIINDILDMSRIESGRMAIKHEEFSFSRMLEQVNALVISQSQTKKQKYDCRVLGHVDDYFVGDDMKLQQILINILGNAVKFTPEEGSITFLIEETARFSDKVTLRFTIRDTGIGISADYLPRIFNAFSQEDSSSTNRYGSSGLGLAITKSLVEMMDGNIEVESEKGKGTTFTVSVTLQTSNRKANDGCGCDIRPGELRVLVIDDDPVACEHAQLVLGNLGIECDTALSGAEGIEKVELHSARRAAYDLILVDWRMPEMDGLETTRSIRYIAGDDTTVIILTSFNWDEIMDEAREAGVDGFAPKPLFAAAVLDEFREICLRKKAVVHASKAKLEGRRILLAEDMPVNAEIMTMVLEMREMTVDLAENGRQAVEAFASHPAGYYSAILMDMRMP